MKDFPFNPLNHPVSFERPLRVTRSSWVQHVPFGMFLVDILKPKVIVELGTYYGVSYCAFCQAVKYLKLDTKCYAIDTWQGDSHGGVYGDAVFKDLKLHHDSLYSSFSSLVKSIFDDALIHFSDGEVDLLHIDGFHTYEAVKNDFFSWLPKMSKGGVIILHDINVKEKIFGVHKLWNEVKNKYPHFEMIHEHGLGILIVGANASKTLLEIASLPTDNRLVIRNFFHQLGLRLRIWWTMPPPLNPVTQKIK